LVVAKPETLPGAPPLLSYPVPPGQRWIYATIGWLFVVLGVIGAVVPILPTTPFLLVSVWAFGKSSSRLEQWLLNHPWFGPSLRRFREQKIVPWSVKLVSWGSMVVALALSIASRRIPWWGIAAQAAVMAYGAWFVGRFPSERKSSS
jgi:uncharacterized protein